MLEIVPHSREFRNVGSDVGPGLAAVTRKLYKPIIDASSDDAWAIRDCKHHVFIFHAEVICREATGKTLSTMVVPRQIGADDLPTVSLVVSSQDRLAAHVYLM